MICICIGEPTIEICKKILSAPDVEMAEIRLDGVDLTPAEIQTVFSLHSRLIATCRPGRHTRDERLKILTAAVAAGSAFLDLEIEADSAFKETLIQMARVHGCGVILSHHNFDNTPSRSELEAIVDRCFSGGADIVKVVCQVHSVSDCIRILSLYDHPKLNFKNDKPGELRRMVALGMGERGKITRVAAPFLGAPFTYASIKSGLETGPGQLDADTLGKIYRLLNI